MRDLGIAALLAASLPATAPAPVGAMSGQEWDKSADLEAHPAAGFGLAGRDAVLLAQAGGGVRSDGAKTDGDDRARPMRPSDEANAEQLDLAKRSGDAFGALVEAMTKKEAHDGGERRAGDYLVGFAVEQAEGMWRMQDGQLRWTEPEEENAHVEVVVRDGADGRFIPGLTVRATLIDPRGGEVGTHEQPFLWHPWLFHYGRNWKVPGDGSYTLRVRIEPPTFMRHDSTNGDRYAQAVEVEFRDVKIKTGRK